MHKTAQEWSQVIASAVTAGSAAQATNVLQMALDDIAALAAMETKGAAEYHVITIAHANEDEDYDTHYVAPTSLEARHIMAGGAEPPTAVGSSYQNACLIVHALNALSEKYRPAPRHRYIPPAPPENQR